LNKKPSESNSEQASQSDSEQQDQSDQVSDYETGEGSEGEHDHEHTDDQGHDIQYEGSSTSSPSTSDNSKYQESTQKLIDDAEEAKRQLQETARNGSGPNGEFASMIDHCFEYEDREYVYKLCPFEKTVQKSKSSHVETSIGHWKSWNQDGDNKYASMKFENGLACWNGSQRSTKVLLTCGLEN
jgi:protein kinase C substrate 80K-H